MALSTPSSRADHWRLGKRVLPCGARPLLMGILNVTPDSFSDGGRFLDRQAAVARGLDLVSQGADLLDIGGESTRPRAEPVSQAEELRRVLPVIQELLTQVDIPLSIDTCKPAVAREALDAGAECLNDVTGMSHPEMVELACRSTAGLCVMHMQGTPRTMQERPYYGDVFGEVADFLRERRDALVAAGIAQDRIALDPGIGFGKTTEHNLELLRKADRLHELGCPVMVGHSRKRYLAEIAGDRTADRLGGTIGGAIALAQRGVQILRVHDVAAVRQALLIWEACGGLEH
ncbi:MAG: dihydropteroate synthase [Thermoguttaceae bacterium]